MFTRLPYFTLLVFTAAILSGCLIKGVLNTTLDTEGPEFEPNQLVNFELIVNEKERFLRKKKRWFKFKEKNFGPRIINGQGDVLTLYRLVNGQPDTTTNYIVSANIEREGSEEVKWEQVGDRLWHRGEVKYYLGTIYRVTTQVLPPGKYQFTVKGYKQILNYVSTTDDDFQFTIATSTLESITHDAITYNPIRKAGRVWLDRNLGASQACGGTNDENCHGCLYPWSREFNASNGALCPVGYRVPSAKELSRLLRVFPTAADALQDSDLSIPQQGSSSQILKRAANTCANILSTDISAVNAHIIASTGSDTCDSGITAGVDLPLGGTPPSGATSRTASSALSGDAGMQLIIQNTSDDYGPICPASTTGPAQYIVGKDDYATLWSSSKATHGYHYAFFTAKTNGEHRRDQDGYFPIRCIKEI